MKKIERLETRDAVFLKDKYIAVKEAELDALEQQIEKQQEKINRECIWIWDNPDYEEGYYNTACQESFLTIADSIGEDGFKYCPYCGGKIKAGEK